MEGSLPYIGMHMIKTNKQIYRKLHFWSFNSNNKQSVETLQPLNHAGYDTKITEVSRTVSRKAVVPGDRWVEVFGTFFF